MSQDKNTADEIKETVKEIYNNVSEVLTERVFRPMYFYFIISWSIINWKFLYVFLFGNEEIIVEQKSILKVEYLSSLYEWSSWQEASYSLLFLVVLPAISAFVVVWWLSLLSEMFFEKNEQYKLNISSIKRRLEYKNKVDFAKEQRAIRDAESDKKDIRYEDNAEFNDDFDSVSEDVVLAGANFKPSEVLYNNDYDLYVEALKEFNEKQKDSD